MKWGLFSILMVLGILYTPIQTRAQSVGVSNAAITPDASSMFEVRATNKGMLIPRVALTATNAAGPIASPATSLLVYNTATAGSGTATGVYPGYYYNAGTPAAPNWKRLAEGTGSGDAWLTTGNFGTTPANNWLGTNDAQDFVIRSNNTERMRVVSGGNVIVNTTAPIDVTDALEVVVSPTFTTGLGAYGNGGYPIYAEQLSGADDAITAINSAATGAGNGCGLFGASNQTGGAGIFGYGSTYTRGVLGLTINATYAGVQGQNGHGDGDGVYGINNAATGAGGGAGVYGYSSQTGAAGVIGSGNTTTRGVLGINTNATYAAVQGQNGSVDGIGVLGLNTGAAGVNTGVGVWGETSQGGFPAAGVVGLNAHANGPAMIAYNAAVSGPGSADGIYAYTEQSSGMAVSAWSGNATGTAVLGGGNNNTAYYMPEGSGGAFTGQYYGAYGMAYDSLTSRTSYTENACGVFGKAVYNRTAWTNFYHFGVYGQYFDNNGARNGRRSGGVLGYGANGGTGAWGSLGYLASTDILYGGYFTSPALYTTGAGKEMNQPSSEIGIGVIGGFMGAHITGEEYGLVVEGSRFGILIEGQSYSTDVYAMLTPDGEGSQNVSYATMATKPMIYASGQGTMNSESVFVEFDQNYASMVSSNDPIIVTITPTSPNNGLYIEYTNAQGFSVKANSNNNSSSETATVVTFNWIAMATVTGKENMTTPAELTTDDFHQNMENFIKAENNFDQIRPYLWWDGQQVRYDEPTITRSNIIPEVKQNSVNMKTFNPSLIQDGSQIDPSLSSPAVEEPSIPAKNNNLSN
ncbi:MAG: hypothetical protein JXR53_08035 [Bacteroidales bacterium]|nr:hypothetical protein [Bacteroidales bacterium]